MRVRFVVVDGPETGRTFSFDAADSFLVGRSPKAHLVLDPRADRYISRTHCLIDIRPPRCIVNDLGSTNGTFVNEQRVSRAELTDGDEVRVGRTRIRIVMEQEPQAAAQPAAAQPAAAQPDTRQLSVAPADRSWQPPQVEGSWAPPDFVPAAAGAPSPPVAAAPAFAPAADQPERQYCHHCGNDLAGWQPDALVTELPDACYLCTSCELTLTRRSNGTTTIGDYTVLGELGRGGMGVVLKGVHHQSRRICAIKELLPAVAHDERTFRLFEREIGIQSRVIHPNLARLLDHGRHGGDTCYFVAEYLAGGDAGQLVATVFRGPVELRLAVRIMIDALAGLEALHQNGFVHRDLKPANILLSRPHGEAYGTAKITDCGLAKSFEEAGNSLFDITREGEAAGSLMFMPPEQILNYRFVRPPADVYAAGVSLYFLLTGQYTVQFPVRGLAQPVSATGQARNPIEIMVEDPPIPIRQRNPAIPPPVAEVVDRAVQKELSQRYQTAAEMRRELHQAAQHGGLL